MPVPLGITLTPGKLYLAMRYENGETAGYAELKDGKMKLPSKLLPRSNVVRLKTA